MFEKSQFQNSRLIWAVWASNMVQCEIMRKRNGVKCTGLANSARYLHPYRWRSITNCVTRRHKSQKCIPLAWNFTYTIKYAEYFPHNGKDRNPRLVGLALSNMCYLNFPTVSVSQMNTPQIFFTVNSYSWHNLFSILSHGAIPNHKKVHMFYYKRLWRNKSLLLSSVGCFFIPFDFAFLVVAFKLSSIINFLSLFHNLFRVNI